MTYEQSLKNVEILRNFASPLDGYSLTFLFKNSFDFDLFFFKSNSCESDTNHSLRIRNSQLKLPFATLFLDKQYDYILQYDDQIIDCRINLTKKIIIENSLYMEITKEMLQKELYGLIKLIENK